MTTNLDIDFVITWVDMEDPVWQAEFNQYANQTNNNKNALSHARFRDAGFLKYWFRGVEKFAPWVRKIHFVTHGHTPEWLDTSHPKINLVDHTDFIPHKYLPVFNSSLIEIYLHKIPDLAEHFVYFNDDFYITNDIGQERFFQNGLPCDIAAFRHNFGSNLWGKCLKNNLSIINERFDKKEVLARDYDKWFFAEYGKKAQLTKLMQWYDKFITLRTPHNAQPYLKSTFEEVWNYAGDKLSVASENRFRSTDDYTQELFRTWQICQSNFTPYNTYQDTKMFPLLIKSKQAIKAIEEQSYKLICLNDNDHIKNYDQIIRQIDDAFTKILPNKSTFEKS